MKQKAKSVGEFVEKYHEEFELSKSSFVQYIASVRVGKMMGASTGVSKGFGYSNKELSRLSKLLKILEISGEETPIRGIMRHYSD